MTTLLALSQAERDMQVSRVTFTGLVRALLVDDGGATRERDVASLAVGLRARIDDLLELSAGERLLLAELLDGLAA